MATAGGDADLGVAGLGGAGDVVVYSLSYPWTALTPLLAPFLNGTNAARRGRRPQ
jgi:hypothetical protein